MPFELNRLCADCGQTFRPYVRKDMSAPYYCPECDRKTHSAARRVKPAVAKPRGPGEQTTNRRRTT